MKTLLVAFKENFNISSKTLKVIDCLTGCNINVDKIEILSENDKSEFKNIINKTDYENVIVLDSERKEINLSTLISETLSLLVEENENAKQFINAVIGNGESIEEYKGNYLLPKGAKIFPNINGYYQGYAVENNNISIIVLPLFCGGIESLIEKYLTAYLDKKYNLEIKHYVLKYFGDKEKLNVVLEKSKQVSDIEPQFSVIEKDGDITVGVNFTVKGNSQEIIRYIVSNLKDDIYAEYDVSLSERLFDICKLKKLKIAVSESFTGGRIVSSLIKNSGASEVVNEGLVSYSNQSKMARLFVKPESIKNDGAISSVVAYEMALGLLKTGVDLAISTTGLAGPNSDEGKPVGLCFIGIGTREGIHTYKLNLKGTREEITEQAKNTALFLAIKRIKTYKEEL